MKNDPDVIKVKDELAAVRFKEEPNCKVAEDGAQCELDASVLNIFYYVFLQ